MGKIKSLQMKKKRLGEIPAGAFDGTRILNRVSRLHEFAVEHMDGFGFGPGVAVRTQAGVAGGPGTPGEFCGAERRGPCSGSIPEKKWR